MVAVADLLVGLAVLVVVLVVGDGAVEEPLGLDEVLTTGAEIGPAEPGSPEHPVTSSAAATAAAAADPTGARFGRNGARGIPHCA
jgi:hypothetical protein